MKILLRILVALVIVIGAAFAYVSIFWLKNVDAEYPIPEITIKADSAMLARGAYLVNGPAHCVGCHIPIEQLPRVAQGEKLPLIGGFEFDFPLGKIYSRNITPDPETGIGRYTDGQLYRMLRENITPAGKPTIDLMPFTEMSDYDIKSIIAYLRVQEPVRNEIPENEMTFLGKLVFGFILEVAPHEGTPPVIIEKDSSILYGEYLAKSVSNCRGCHTKRDLKSGAYIGPYYAGGFTFAPSAETGGWTFTSPNLTFHEGTSIVAGWSEENFIERFKTGRVHPTSPMPWESFKLMDETDLKAIYRFLKTVGPIENKIEQIAVAPN
ncbi:MAG: cytochrome C [Bacteroidota bacterium]